MSQAPISALHQDHVSRQNNAQARRHSADARSQDAAPSFADLLRASESPETDPSPALTLDTPPQDDATDTATDPADPSVWLALAQAGATEPTTSTENADGPMLADALDPDGAVGSMPGEADETALDGATTDGQTLDAQDNPTLAQDNPTPRRATPRPGASGAVSQAPGLADPRASAAAVLGAGPAGAALSAAATPAQAVLAQAGAVAHGLWRAPAGAHQAATTSEPGAASAEGPTTAGPDGLTALGAQAPRAVGGGTPPSGGEAGMGADAPGETPAGEHTDEAASPTEWAERWQQAMDDVGQQVSYWLGKGVRQAQIQVRAGLDRPIDVTLSVENGQAALRFLTDSASARAAIESGAADVLRDWLARDGIGLAGLSVGSQASSQGDDAAGARHGRLLRGLSAPVGATTTDGALSLPATARSTRALDVYA